MRGRTAGCQDRDRFERLNREVIKTLEHAVQPSTQTSYESTVRRFWIFHLSMWKAPSASDWELVCNPRHMDVIRWLQSCSTERDCKHSTIQTYWRNLRAFYNNQMFVDTFKECPAIEVFVKRLRVRLGSQTASKRAILPHMLLAMKAKLDLSKPEDAALWSCMLTLFFGLFRKSHCMVPNLGTGPDYPTLRVEHVSVAGDNSLRLQVYRSKTDPTGSAPRTTVLAGWAGAELDPVRAWQNHVGLNAPLGSDPAFTYLREGSRTPMVYTHFLARLKGLVSELGYDPTQVAGHSFRRGGATFAYRCGVQTLVIKHQGMWKPGSTQFERYIEMCHRESLMCSRKMLEAVIQGRRGMDCKDMQTGEDWEARDGPAICLS